MKGLRLLRGSLLLASLAIAAVPIPASADDLVADVVLYETSETIAGTFRSAPLLGLARIDSPLCEAVPVPITGSTCTVTGVGTIDLSPLYAVPPGPPVVSGSVAVVVEGAALAPFVPGTPDTNTTDVAEVVLVAATFTADPPGITPAPLPDRTPPGLAEKLQQKFVETGFWSLLRIQGTLTIGSSAHGFEGIFRLPFALSGDGKGSNEDVLPPQRNKPAFYLGDDGKLIKIRSDELAIGYPTPRLEVTFTP